MGRTTGFLVKLLRNVHSNVMMPHARYRATTLKDAVNQGMGRTTRFLVKRPKSVHSNVMMTHARYRATTLKDAVKHVTVRIVLQRVTLRSPTVLKHAILKTAS